MRSSLDRHSPKIISYSFKSPPKYIYTFGMGLVYTVHSNSSYAIQSNASAAHHHLLILPQMYLWFS